MLKLLLLRNIRSHFYKSTKSLKVVSKHYSKKLNNQQIKIVILKYGQKFKKLKLKIKYFCNLQSLFKLVVATKSDNQEPITLKPFNKEKFKNNLDYLNRNISLKSLQDNRIFDVLHKFV